MKDLREKTIRGGLARIASQSVAFAIRLFSLMILARLLGPNEFGLIGMVTAFTGVLSLFRDFGLSSAAIQRDTMSHEQSSTLFWINVFVGGVLTFACAALAPAIAAFYHEPRLISVTAAMSLGFIINALGVQHSVKLQREMRFTALSVVNTLSLVVGSTIGIVCAWIGYGYWSLVAMSICQPMLCTMGMWIATRWMPGRPHRRSEIRAMMRFGGLMTANSLIYYLIANVDKILLGRFWGVDALGIYTRAFSLINIPTDNLNTAAGEVAFSALSRLQGDPARMRTYFLKGYSLLLAITLPTTIACALFADDVVYVALGPKWMEAATIFRLLAPTILTFAIVNPLGWLIYALGLATRGLWMALALTPLMVVSCFVAIPYGAVGVAFAFSAVMMVWIVPGVIWATHGTVVSPKDILKTVAHPLASGLAGAVVGFGVAALCADFPHIIRLIIETAALLLGYAAMLLFAKGQRAQYRDILNSLRKRPADAGAVA